MFGGGLDFELKLIQIVKISHDEDGEEKRRGAFSILSSLVASQNLKAWAAQVALKDWVGVALNFHL